LDKRQREYLGKEKVPTWLRLSISSEIVYCTKMNSYVYKVKETRWLHKNKKLYTQVSRIKHAPKTNLGYNGESKMRSYFLKNICLVWTFAFVGHAYAMLWGVMPSKQQRMWKQGKIQGKDNIFWYLSTKQKYNAKNFLFVEIVLSKSSMLCFSRLDFFV